MLWGLMSQAKARVTSWGCALDTRLVRGIEAAGLLTWPESSFLGSVLEFLVNKGVT